MPHTLQIKQKLWSDAIYSVSQKNPPPEIFYSSESPSETLQSLPVSVAATMNFAQMQTKVANYC